MVESTEQLPKWISFYAVGEAAKKPEVIKKFMHAIEHVLASLPKDDLSVIVSRYDNGSRLGVQLRDSHRSLKEGPTKDACAQCIISALGDELIFKAGTVQQLPNSSLQHLIAHELGHLFLRPSRREDDEEEEVEKMIVERWKFPADGESNLKVSLYLIANGIRPGEQ
jgi:hypothetical protein